MQQSKPQRPRQAIDNLLALPNGTLLAGDYRIERVLGAGGFGITYFADDVTLHRPVAIKEYFPSDFAARDSTMMVRSKSTSCAEDYAWGLERFIEEAQTLAKFEHPNIARVYRYFRANNTGYMVLQFEEGRSFKAWLDKLGRPPAQGELDDILAPLLTALELIHAQDFLHRDIAPDNIIIRPDGSPVLIDFGSARGEVAQHSRTVSALVKPGYSPFEQYAATAKQQGPWTDIYAMGATLYHAVTGSRPADAPTRMTADELKPAAEAARSRYRPAFLKAIDRALSLKPEMRPRSVGAWRRELLGDAGNVAVLPKVKAVAPAGPLAKTRKVETGGLPRIVRWPRKAPVAAVEPSPAPARPAPAPPAVVAAAAKAAPVPEARLLARRSLVKLLDGVRAAVAAAGTASPEAGSAPAVAPAPAPAPAAERFDDVTTEIARRIRSRRPPRAFLRRPRVPMPKLPSLALPRPGWRWLWRLPWLQLSIISAVVGTMIYVQDSRVPERPEPFAGAVNTTTDVSLVRAIRPEMEAIRALAVSPDGRMIALAGAEGSIEVLDPTGLAPARSFGSGRSELTSLDISADALVAARRDGSIDVFDLLKGERTRSFAEPGGPVWSVRFAGSSRQILAAGADRKVRLLDRERGVRQTLTGSANDVLAVAYAPGRRLIAAGGSDKLVHIYEERHSRESRTLAGHTDDVSALAFSPDGSLLASASFDGTAILWSVETGARLRKLEGHANRLTSVAFSADGALLATASEDGTARVWSVRTGELVHSYVGHAGAVRGVAFLPWGSLIVTAGDDRTVRVWNARIAGFR